MVWETTPRDIQSMAVSFLEAPYRRNVKTFSSFESQDVETSDLRSVVKRAAGGDEGAAAELFDTFHPRVFRYALGKLRNPSDAEDVAAETFARVLRDLGKFRWKGAGFEAWLFRIASNLVVDHVRRAGREMADEMVIDKVDEGDDDMMTPEGALLEAEQAQGLSHMLDRLVPEQREVLLLRFAAGLDAAESGKVMGKKPNAIRQLQFRALANVRQMMEKELGRL
jgi:RNA polymerase sigma-70 factor, ECF subfamily